MPPRFQTETKIKKKKKLTAFSINGIDNSNSRSPLLPCTSSLLNPSDVAVVELVPKAETEAVNNSPEGVRGKRLLIAEVRRQEGK